MADPRDIVALEKLQDYRAGELARVRTRAEKWIPGLAAVTAVLTTAIVVKGAETFTGLEQSTQAWIIGLMIAGGVGLALGTWCAYAAAHGNPFGDNALLRRAEQQQVENAYHDWNAAVKKMIESARSLLTIAVVATILGTGSLGVAVVVTWFAPTTFTCVATEDGQAKLKGVQPEVVEGKLTFVECT